MRVIETFAEDNRLPSVKDIRDGCGAGKLSNSDKAIELVNAAVQGIGQFGLDAKKARDKLPAISFMAVKEWGGWYAWASLNDERLDGAKKALRGIIERMLRTGEIDPTQLCLVDTQTFNEIDKIRAAQERAETYRDPEKVNELKKTAAELAEKFGFKK